MTTWTDTSTIETSWNEGTGQNTGTSIKYNDINIAYNLDYITYNGYYVQDETDWSGTATIETSWASA